MIKPGQKVYVLMDANFELMKQIDEVIIEKIVQDSNGTSYMLKNVFGIPYDSRKEVYLNKTDAYQALRKKKKERINGLENQIIEIEKILLGDIIQEE